MITQYLISLKNGNQAVPSFYGYRLYSWLLQELPAEIGDVLHLDGEKPLSQYLYWDWTRNCSCWVLNSLSDELSALIAPILTERTQIPLNTGDMEIEAIQCNRIPIEHLVQGQEASQKRYRRIQFRTVTTFKQSGRYVLFPDERLLLQNLIAKWNASIEGFSLDDPDVFNAMSAGLRIVAYSLHSSVFPLKEVKIPGFLGEITVLSSLPAPLDTIWQTLLRFAPYSGIGVKTTLGMGGIWIPG